MRVSTVVYLVLSVVIVFLVYGVAGDYFLETSIPVIPSDACMTCHLDAEVINSMYTPPEQPAQAGG